MQLKWTNLERGFWILPLQENIASAIATPVSRTGSVSLPTALPTPDSELGSPIPQVPLVPLVTDLNGASGSLQKNPVPVTPPVNTVKSISTPVGASISSRSHKANMIRSEITNLGSTTTTPILSKARFGFHRRSEAPPTPVSASDSPSSKAP
ncbi:hypothetical protein FRB94_013421, partial [Tulasnella sp. JGI-2019a]